MSRGAHIAGRPAILLVLALAGGLRCAADNAALKEEEESDYSRTARENFEKAEEAFEDGRYQEAIRYFSHVQNKFPYSQYAATAGLRIADSHFERGHFIEAIDAYRLFSQMHPTHRKTPYALFRIGLAFYEQMPGSFWVILPPPHERDNTATRDAIRALEYLLEMDPGGEYGERARRLIQVCRRRLAKYEYYVARYYWKRDRYRAVARRLEGLLQDYPHLGFDPQARFTLALAYLELEENARARTHLETLIEEDPGGHHTREARRLLDQLNGQRSLEHRSKSTHDRADPQ